HWRRRAPCPPGRGYHSLRRSFCTSDDLVKFCVFIYLNRRKCVKPNREHSSVPFAHMLDSSLIFVNPTPDPVRIRADYLDSSCPLHLLLGESGLFVQIPFV